MLHPGCRLCINIGDQFARSVYYGRYKVIPIRTEIIKFCETIGFDYMGAVIWQKVTTINTTVGASIMGSFPYLRKLTFGSRIEKEGEAEREEFFKVKEILSPEKVRLSNGLTVKLDRHQERTVLTIAACKIRARSYFSRSSLINGEFSLPFGVNHSRI